MLSNSYYLQNTIILDVIDIFALSMAVPIFWLVVITVTTAITASRLHCALKWRHHTIDDVNANSSGGARTASVVGRVYGSHSVPVCVSAKLDSPR